MIALGCDHAGFPLMQIIRAHLREQGVSFQDFGTTTPDPVDYPAIAEAVAKAVANGSCETGILVCGTGVGMSMAANKIPGIRAAACSEHYSTKYTRLHNDANILCLGARITGPGTALELCDIFLHTAFEGGRHQRRVDMINRLDIRQ